MNLQKTIYFWDVYGCTEKNYDNILDLAVSGQLKDRFKEGDQISIEKQILKPTINDKVHAVVMVMDATNLFSDLNKALYKDNIKKFQDKGKVN